MGLCAEILLHCKLWKQPFCGGRGTTEYPATSDHYWDVDKGWKPGKIPGC